MQIKIQLGKLEMSDSLPAILKTQQVENHLQVLTINLNPSWSNAGAVGCRVSTQSTEFFQHK